MNITNYEETIVKHAHSLYSLERVCEAPDHPSLEDIIERCHKGMLWSPRETATKKFPLIHSMFKSFTTEFLQQQKGTSIARDKRFVVSFPILIGTAIGVSSIATAGVTAAVIAKHESGRIINEVCTNRMIDINNSIHNNKLNFNISFTEAISANAITSLSHSIRLNNEISHLFSKSSTLEFSDPLI